MASKSGIASGIGMTALALSFVAGSAFAGTCASREELSALRVAALRQQLMVAALECHQASSFNRFVTSHRREFQEWDRTLMRFFVREDGSRGADDSYNAYKTRQANDASLRSLNDPEFCGQAREAFAIAFARNLHLAELATKEARLIRTGFERCSVADADTTEASVVAPALPHRHTEFSDDGPAVSKPASDVTTGAPLPAKQIAKGEQQPQKPQDAARPPADPPTVTSPDQPDSMDDKAAPDRDPADAPLDDYREAYNGPFADQAPPIWYGPQAPMHQIQGPDGRWYLIPYRRSHPDLPDGPDDW